MFRKNFEYHCSLSSLYLICSKEMLNCIHTLNEIHWTVFIKAFQFALISDSWNLVYCPTVGNHWNYRKYCFHSNQSHNVSSKNILSKWMQFQNVLSFGRCIVTNVCIFKLLSSKCTRDTAIEKEFDIAKQIKLDMF